MPQFFFLTHILVKMSCFTGLVFSHSLVCLISGTPFGLGKLGVIEFLSLFEIELTSSIRTRRGLDYSFPQIVFNVSPMLSSCTCCLEWA